MPASKPYRFHPQAWLDLETADDWYRERSADASVRFLSAVYDGLEKIVRSPQRWPKHLRGTKRFILHRFPFSIIYREESSAINVVAIAHHKRQPRYWKDRL
jgi:plasmid stabilization system protein ParE